MIDWSAVQRARSESTDLDDRVVYAIHQGVIALRHALHGRPLTPGVPGGFVTLFEAAIALVAQDRDLARCLRELPQVAGAGLLLNTLFDELSGSTTEPAPAAAPGTQIARLSPREAQVLLELAKGHPQKQIALTLGIELSTVRTHVGRIHKKLQVSNTQEAINAAKSLGAPGPGGAALVQATLPGPTTAPTHLALLVLQWLERGLQRGVSSEGQALGALGALLLMIAVAEAGVAEEAPGQLPTAGAGVVLEYDVGGELVRVMDGGGCLGRPGSLAVAPPQAASAGFTPGHLYVADTGVYTDGLNHACVVELTPQGECVKVFTGGNHFSSRLESASGLAFSGEGMLLFADRRSGAILRFSEGGARIERFIDTIPSGGIAVDGEGRVYVSGGAGREKRVWVYGANGSPLERLPWTADRECGPIEVDGEGNVYVRFSGESEIAVCDRRGEPAGRIAHGQLRRPRHMAAGPPHRLYVLEEDRKTIHAFETESRSYLFSIIGPAGKRLDGLAVDAEGNLFVGAAPA